MELDNKEFCEVGRWEFDILKDAMYNLLKNVNYIVSFDITNILHYSKGYVYFIDVVIDNAKYVLNQLSNDAITLEELTTANLSAARFNITYINTKII